MRLSILAALAALLATGCKSTNRAANVKFDGPDGVEQQDGPAAGGAPSLWAGVRRDSVTPAQFDEALATARTALGGAATTLVPYGEGNAAAPAAVVVAGNWTTAEDAAVAPLWAVADVARSSGYPLAPAAAPAPLERAVAQVATGTPAEAGYAKAAFARAFKADFDGDKLAESLAAHQKLVADAGDKLKPYAIVVDHGYVLELVKDAAAKEALDYVWASSPLRYQVNAGVVAYQAP